MSLPILILLAAAANPGMPSPPETYRAIWHDIMVNAMIGNGNDLVTWDWAYGHDEDHSPTVKVADLTCRPWRREVKCRFALVRTANPESSAPKDAKEPPRLDCEARLRLQDNRDGKGSYWSVAHIDPHRFGAHSETTLQCKAP